MRDNPVYPVLYRFEMSEMIAILAGETGAGNLQSMLYAGERISHQQVARECEEDLQA